MKGDLSRETFDPAARYSAVRLQQGRVITDADFNEQGDITRYQARRLAEDTIGSGGAPADHAGYALTAGTRALAVHAASANVVWIAGEDGVLLRSTDGGATWSLRDSGSTRHLRAVARAANTGWAVGDGGTVLRSSDGGQSWTAQNTGSVQQLRGVAVLDAQHAWAVGDGGLVLVTSDSGASWSQHAAGVERLHAVAFADVLRGLAVGQGGAMVQSADGGQSWTAVDSGTGAHLRAVALSGSSAWAVGDAGTLLRSTDGGATWASVATGATGALRAVRFRNASEGWAVGEGGTVLYSANGGASWTLLDTGNGQDLTDLSVSGTEAAWAVGGNGPAWRLGNAAAPTALQSLDLPATSLHIQPGRCYVQGQLCELDAPASLANQPDGGVAGRLPAGTHLIYLRAWQRHISALEAPCIREQALGGPDTATRARQIAQVRALALPAPTLTVDGGPGAAWHCDSTLGAWDRLVHTPRARLAARAEPQLSTTGLCEIAASAGYQRLENQLYRVEVHSSGTAPTFKWSRENGSVAYAVQEVRVDTATSRTTVRLAARGRDANLDLALHDRVELVDDDAELQHRAGTLFEYLNDGDDALELVLDGVPPGTLGQDPSRHPVLRRWDHRPTTAGENALPIVEGTWTTLEDGVQVRFEAGGSYRPGDYWQIPARTVSADVEWPRDADGEPLALDSAGIEDGWCRLGLVEVDAGGLVSVTGDCRSIFPSLTQLTQLLYVGGDGQDTAPGTVLPQPLLVRVARCRWRARACALKWRREAALCRAAPALTLSATKTAWRSATGSWARRTTSACAPTCWTPAATRWRRRWWCSAPPPACLHRAAAAVAAARSRLAKVATLRNWTLNCCGSCSRTRRATCASAFCPAPTRLMACRLKPASASPTCDCRCTAAGQQRLSTSRPRSRWKGLPHWRSRTLCCSSGLLHRLTTAPLRPPMRQSNCQAMSMCDCRTCRWPARPVSACPGFW